jgi:hypothetical protein
MSHPWPFIVPFESDGNLFWQELQDTYYSRARFDFSMEPDVDFRSVRLPDARAAADGPRALARFLCRVSGMPSRFDFYRRSNWFSRVERANVDVTVPSVCTNGPAAEGGKAALLTIPGRDLACKSGPHYVAVAKAAWLLAHAVSLRELTLRVTVQGPQELGSDSPVFGERPEKWWGLMEPFVGFKSVVRLAVMYRNTRTSTAGLIYANDEWCSDFHVGYSRSSSVVRRCPDPTFEPLPGNHWGSYVSIGGVCPCGRSFEDLSSHDGKAEDDTPPRSSIEDRIREPALLEIPSIS